MFPKFVDIVDNIQGLLSTLLVRGELVEFNQTKLAALADEVVLKKRHFEKIV